MPRGHPQREGERHGVLRGHSWEYFDRDPDEYLYLILHKSGGAPHSVVEDAGEVGPPSARLSRAGGTRPTRWDMRWGRELVRQPFRIGLRLSPDDEDDKGEAESTE